MPITKRVSRDGTVFVTGIERGHVFWVDVPQNQTQGAEQYKRRPWVVVSRDSLHGQDGMPLVIAVPLTTNLEKDAGTFRRHRVRVLDKDFNRFAPEPGSPASSLPTGDSLALTEQVRALAHARLDGDPIAKVTKQALFAIEAGLMYVMGLKAP